MILSEQEGQEEVIGGFRDTKRGIDAYAQTLGYDPGRSQKEFATIEDAMNFVESFRPWELHGVQDVTVEREARLVSGRSLWANLTHQLRLPNLRSSIANRQDAGGNSGGGIERWMKALLLSAF